MVGNCEVTWAAAGWNKNDNDDGRDSDDRGDDGDDSFSFICMGLHSVRWKWLDDHCDSDDLYNDHHGEFKPGGQGRGSNGQRHQVKQKPSYSYPILFLALVLDKDIHGWKYSPCLTIYRNSRSTRQDECNHHPLIALLINFNDPRSMITRSRVTKSSSSLHML